MRKLIKKVCEHNFVYKGKYKGKYRNEVIVRYNCTNCNEVKLKIEASLDE